MTEDSGEDIVPLGIGHGLNEFHRASVHENRPVLPNGRRIEPWVVENTDIDGRGDVTRF